MNLIFHHFRKDLRAQSWFLLLWLVVLFAMCLQDFLILSPDYDTARFFDTFSMSPLAFFAGLLTWTILIARLIQSEPVTGSTSFWRTRPVPKGVFVASKLLFLVFLLLLPALLPVLFHAFLYRPSSHQVISQTAALLFVQILAMIFVVWLATYTPTLMHLAGALCLCFVLYVVVILFTVAFHLGLGRGNAELVFGGNPELVFVNVVFPGLLLSIIWQHWRRGSVWGFPIGIASLVLGLVLQLFAPESSAPAYNLYPPTGRKATVEFQPDWSSHVTWGVDNYNNVERRPQATAPLVPVEDKPEVRTMVQSISATFQPDGDVEEYLGDNDRFFGFRPFGQNREDELLKARFPNVTFQNEFSHGEVNPPNFLFELNPGMDQRLRGTTGKLVLKVHGQLIDFQALGELPASDPRQILRIPGGFIRVAPLRPNARDQLTLWMQGPFGQISASERFVCVLVDPQTHTGRVLTSSGSSSTSSGFLISGEGTSDSMVTYGLTGNEPLERMTVYVFAFTPVADFETVLVAPHFKMNQTKP